MKILTREQLDGHLRDYYLEHYGERDTDQWYDRPAANVWLFAREGTLIALKCHILTGEVTAHAEPLT